MFGKIIGLLALMLALSGCGCTVVSPGNRGVLVTMGEVDQKVYPEGVVWHKPMIADVHEISVRQNTGAVVAQCYSADLQQITAHLKILYRIPEANVVVAFQKYSGSMLDTLIAPRVQEALKEITATESAEGVVKKRESVKLRALELARSKVGNLLIIEDLVIENLDLSKDLEQAIEQKMVQEQEAAKAKFTQQKAEIEAQTAVIRAKGEAEAINVRGKAIRDNPGLIDLQTVEKWNGVAPLVVGSGSGSNILLPLSDHKK